MWSSFGRLVTLPATAYNNGGPPVHFFLEKGTGFEFAMITSERLGGSNEVQKSKVTVQLAN
jgi:hypothetical protein